MSKTALLVGCGSKSGLDLTNAFLSAGYMVDLISSTDAEILNTRQCCVNWDKLTQANIESFLKSSSEYDVIVFNQNARALEPTYNKPNRFNTIELWTCEKVWNQAYFNNCILPFHIIHTLGKRCVDAKIVWMLSELIYNHTPGVGHADYIGHKYQNYVLMKAFSQQYCCAGINRGKIKIQPNELVSFLEKSTNDINGKVFYSDGTEDTNFNRIINE
jgi:hypothetical protein